MADAVDIANIALSHLGDDATVSSFDPPEGSIQAEHCARWYPIARDNLLEMYDWSFASRRAPLVEVDFPFAQWAHSYVQPNNCLRVRAILDPEAVDDDSSGYPNGGISSNTVITGLYDLRNAASGYYTPQPFVLETDASERKLILTNQADAICRYTERVENPGRFSPLFTDALGWLLAAYLAGPVLKGAAGRQAGRECQAEFRAMLSAASVSDANQSMTRINHAVPWVANR